MKNDFRGKIRAFITSEEGKVGVKGPLTLGVATGSILLAQAIVGTPKVDSAAWQCDRNGDCLIHPRICSVGTCIGGG